MPKTVAAAVKHPFIALGLGLAAVLAAKLAIAESWSVLTEPRTVSDLLFAIVAQVPVLFADRLGTAK